MATIRVERSATATVLTVAGEIDLSNQGQFSAAVDTAAANADRLIVDLNAVTMLSSHAIGVLYGRADRLTAVYVAPDSVIARALSYSGFSSRVPVIGDRGARALVPAPR